MLHQADSEMIEKGITMTLYYIKISMTTHTDLFSVYSLHTTYDILHKYYDH